MAKSKVNKEDAQEWLESLQQVGEGWYRQLALAVRADAHGALGMERREFARQVGQRMIDPRQAIIELHNEGHSLGAIADVLGVSKDRTVARVLAEEGLIDWQPHVAQKALESGYQVPDGIADADKTSADGVADASEVESLTTEIESLKVKLQGERSRADREMEKLRDKTTQLREQLTKAKEEAKKAKESEDQDEERRRKEAEAWAAEEARKALAGLAHLVVDRAVGHLEEATSSVKELIELEALTPEVIQKIEQAHDAFQMEWTVARAATSKEAT